MIPTIQLCGEPVSSYLLMLAVALVLATTVAALLAPRLDIPRAKAVQLAVVSIAAGYAGSRAQSIVLELGPGPWLEGAQGGLAVQGGLLAGGLALIGTARWLRLRWTDALDMAAPAASAALSVGRMSCLLAGCCWGKPTLFPIALVFHDFAAPVRPIGVPLHATQVYASLAAALILIYLVVHRLPRRRFPGQLICDFLVLYGLERFGLELLRADPRGPLLLGLTTPQILALAGLVTGLVGYTPKRPGHRTSLSDGKNDASAPVPRVR